MTSVSVIDGSHALSAVTYAEFANVSRATPAGSMANSASWSVVASCTSDSRRSLSASLAFASRRSAANDATMSAVAAAVAR